MKRPEPKKARAFFSENEMNCVPPAMRDRSEALNWPLPFLQAKHELAFSNVNLITIFALCKLAD